MNDDDTIQTAITCLQSVKIPTSFGGGTNVVLFRYCLLISGQPKLKSVLLLAKKGKLITIQNEIFVHNAMFRRFTMLSEEQIEKHLTAISEKD